MSKKEGCKAVQQDQLVIIKLLVVPVDLILVVFDAACQISIRRQKPSSSPILRATPLKAI
ncbi:hypothetical protein QC763_0070210 [Podospora pseudopauciseta]|uniref:Uncharacterized protein n=1 Tax=Podospora pseudopauciseta TaxID=2093780 RepID=A0ABR0HDQ5_9PEZI|nr:hypothetical protein QC763_0070210 [Podospora pseudopauciseta]